MKTQIKYEVYIEGGLHSTDLTFKAANKVRREAEKEGWNVRVLKIYPTIIGDLGVAS